MGGKIWCADEERVYWKQIIPFSVKRIGIHEANPESSWEVLAVKMTELMGDKALRTYTALSLFEHYFQNVMKQRISPHGGQYVKPHMKLMDELGISRDIKGFKEPKGTKKKSGTSTRQKKPGVRAAAKKGKKGASADPQTEHTPEAVAVDNNGDSSMGGLTAEAPIPNPSHEHLMTNAAFALSMLGENPASDRVDSQGSDQQPGVESLMPPADGTALPCMDIPSKMANAQFHHHPLAHAPAPFESPYAFVSWPMLGADHAAAPKDGARPSTSALNMSSKQENQGLGIESQQNMASSFPIPSRPSPVAEGKVVSPMASLSVPLDRLNLSGNRQGPLPSISSFTPINAHGGNGHANNGYPSSSYSNYGPEDRGFDSHSLLTGQSKTSFDRYRRADSSFGGNGYAVGQGNSGHGYNGQANNGYASSSSGNRDYSNYGPEYRGFDSHSLLTGKSKTGFDSYRRADSGVAGNGAGSSFTGANVWQAHFPPPARPGQPNNVPAPRYGAPMTANAMPSRASPAKSSKPTLGASGLRLAGIVEQPEHDADMSDFVMIDITDAKGEDDDTLFVL